MRHVRTLVALSLLATAAPAAAQQSIEVYGGVGLTATDAESWAGTGLIDWNQTMSEGYGQIFLLERDGVRIGAEVGYQYLLWYQLSVTGFTVDRNVDAYRAMGVVRTPLTPSTFAEATAGIYTFDGFTDLAIGGALGGHIPVSERLSIPVKLRVGTIFDADASMVPIGLAAGVAYDLGSVAAAERR